MSSNIKKELDCIDLPKNWKVFQSKKSNKVYYYNCETKRTQWEHPLTGGRAHKPEDLAKIKKLNIKKQKTTNNTASKAREKAEKQPVIPGEMVERTVQKNKPKIKSELVSVKSGNIPSKNTLNIKVKKQLPCLPPLTKQKSSASEGSVSSSSDRIVAWLEDTSHVNFKEHPIPDIQYENNEQVNHGKLASLNNKGNGKKCKKDDVKISKASVSNILNKLLPNTQHGLHKGVGKSRYTPYKTSRDVLKSKQKQETQVKNFAEHKSEQLSPEIVANFTNKTKEKSSGNSKINKSKTNHETHTKQNLDKEVEKPKLTQQPVNRVPVNKISDSNSQVLNNVLQADDVLAMEEEDEDINTFTSSFENDVDDMEIDNAEEYEKEIVQKLQQMRNNLIVDPTNVMQNRCEMNIANDSYEGSFFIILDTNVLLSHLKFVVELKDFPIQGVGRPTLVIPWVVIQELDNLKDNKWRAHQSKSRESNKVEERVDMLARIAIKFLNSSFQKPDPRVRGQTIDEAAQHVGNLKEECNDDRILQCCLLFKERAASEKCVLFSNDNNLCNKALVNGIKAFNHQRLIPGLRDLFQCGVVVKQAYFKEYKVYLDVQEELAQKREKADEIVCELQMILREGLSYIIETEMKEAYDDLWQQVVSIKPPWTMNDTLQLLDKHWIAVFGHVLKRNQKILVDELRTKFDDRKGIPSSFLFTSEVLQLGLKLFQAFAAHSNYIDAIPKCIAAVNVLIQKCQQHEQEPLNNTPINVNTQQKCLPQRPKATIDELNESGQSDAIRHEEVMDTFNLIWNAVTQFSTQIFTAVGYPHSIPCDLTQELPKASKEEAVQFLGVLCPRLINLVNCIKNILQDPWEKASQNDNLFVQLKQAIAVFLEQVLSQDNNLSPQKLFSFCQDTSMRTALVQGLSQLDQASAMLQHCASCVTQPEGS